MEEPISICWTLNIGWMWTCNRICQHFRFRLMPSTVQWLSPYPSHSRQGSLDQTWRTVDGSTIPIIWPSIVQLYLSEGMVRSPTSSWGHSLVKNSLCLLLGLGMCGGPLLVPVGMILWLARGAWGAPPLGATLPVPTWTLSVFASYWGLVDKQPLHST